MMATEACLCVRPSLWPDVWSVKSEDFTVGWIEKTHGGFYFQMSNQVARVPVEVVREIADAMDRLANRLYA